MQTEVEINEGSNSKRISKTRLQKYSSIFRKKAQEIIGTREEQVFQTAAGYDLIFMTQENKNKQLFVSEILILKKNLTVEKQRCDKLNTGATNIRFSKS